MRPTTPNEDNTGTSTGSATPPPPPPKPDTWLQRHAVLLAAIALGILALVSFAHGVRPQ